MIEAILVFLDLGEHGVYVWSAWALALSALAAMAGTPWLRWRLFLRRIEAAKEIDVDVGQDTHD